jgi:hypothetical protein
MVFTGNPARNGAAMPRQFQQQSNHFTANKPIQEYYRRAAEARRLAKETCDPAEKVDLFAVERRWLSFARSPSEESKR